jgi:hypothetical protein
VAAVTTAPADLCAQQRPLPGRGAYGGSEYIVYETPAMHAFGRRVSVGMLAANVADPAQPEPGASPAPRRRLHARTRACNAWLLSINSLRAQPLCHR